jgi:integrase
MGMSNLRALDGQLSSISSDFDVFGRLAIDSLPLAVKTKESYISAFRCHIMGKFSGKALSQITQNDISLLLAPLNPPIRAKVLAILKSIFREAINQNLIAASPAHGIRIPSSIVPARKFLIWEDIKDAELGNYKTQIHFLALHGLRWGEAVALTQNDIRANRVYINRSIHGSTKSQAGVRAVPLVSEFQPFPRSPKTLRRVLSPYGVCIHSLRHTYAYILKSQGVHVTTAQKLLGHSDVSVTLKVYTQVLDDEIDAAGRLLRLIS